MDRRRFGESVGFVGTGAFLIATLATPVVGQVTTRVNLTSSGSQAETYLAKGGSISADGRYVVFETRENLAPSDITLQYHLYVRDRQTGVNACVSISSTGVHGNHYSGNASISPDVRFVAFRSDAANLVSGDTNGIPDVFVRDRQSSTTERVSVDSSGVQGNDWSDQPSISDDGRYVVFYSLATNLVSGDTNGRADIFVRDRQSGTTERVSVDSAGMQANHASDYPSISADGRYVSFKSPATNLVSGDTNGATDIFVRDRLSGTTERVSVNSAGTEADFGSSWGCISADGRYVAFASVAFNLVSGDTNFALDIFVRDRQTGTTERVSLDSAEGEANDSSSSVVPPWISADGRYVNFESLASNLVSGDTNGRHDVFVRDRQLGTTERVNVSTNGAQANDFSGYHLYPSPRMSPDGRYAIFQDRANGLVSGDTNFLVDVFVRDRAYVLPFTSLCDPGVAGVISCPCSNPPSAPGRGCDNSSETGGAILSASGVGHLTQDTVVFTTSGEMPTALSVLIQGSAEISSGQVYGRGVRCAGGTILPLFTKTASGGSITVPDFGAGDPTVSARSAASGSVIQPGQSRWYAVYYRDPMALCPVNQLGAIPIQTFNVTQTGRVTWWP